MASDFEKTHASGHSPGRGATSLDLPEANNVPALSLFRISHIAHLPRSPSRQIRRPCFRWSALSLKMADDPSARPPRSLPLRIRLPQRPLVPRVWPVLTLLAALACDDGAAPHLCRASAVVPITVSAGTTPTITWAPDCGADFLGVYSGVTGLPAWELRAASRQIPRPVIYGSRPPGVTEERAPEPLQLGADYLVLVEILVGPDTLAALQPFTP